MAIRNRPLKKQERDEFNGIDNNPFMSELSPETMAISGILSGMIDASPQRSPHFHSTIATQSTKL